jgi:exonuclease SbcC
MCYHQAEVDFTGIHVACLSGSNGAGKSALLDAITWALWGKARARRDDELITIGKKEMEVDFIFRLGTESYRVIRKRKTGKRGSSLLDFQLRDNGKWRSVAESSIRATQAKINHVLLLDYDTFVNSAFLRQGRADEFTIKTPAERKRVLGEILELAQWDTYEDRTKLHLKKVQDESRMLVLRLQEIEEELARRPEFLEQVKAAQTELEDLSALLQKAQAAYQEMEKSQAELHHTSSQITELSDRVAQSQQELEALGQERSERGNRLAQYQELIDQSREIEANFQAYQDALERERSLGEKLTAQNELNEQRRDLEAQITEVRHELTTQRELALQKVRELEERLPGKELTEEYEQTQGQVVHLTQLNQAREAARSDLARLAEERASLLAQKESLRSEMDALKKRIETLEQADATCPLCGQQLTDEDCVRLVDDLQAEGKDKGDTFRENQTRLEAIGAEEEGLETQISNSDSFLRDLPGLEHELAILTERIRVGEEVAQELKNAQGELEKVDGELAREAYAAEARSNLEKVLAQAEELGYDAAAHQAARREIEAGQAHAEKKAYLDAARSGLQQEEAALVQLVSTIDRRREQIETDKARIAELEQAEKDLRKQVENAQAVEEDLVRVRKEEAEARQRMGAAQQRLSACEALAQQQESRLSQQRELAHRQSLYEELRTAFGVHGVPAMIIEAAVPEIESEANRLLRRISGGQMAVRLETQRETQAGEVRETLDIRIMDEVGERNYENYSGGEQFRVNFALRIALSRLLARRAGAQLQTLIIDEGFGTQDALGRERLVEAINSIQDEFSLVLVITHIEELQDVFPTRIQVTKLPEGSAIELV